MGGRLVGRVRRRSSPVSDDLLLQLEHDPLGRLLADPGDRLEAGVVLERDRAAQLRRGRAGDDGERDLGADPADREQLHEELALRRVDEAVELQRVLAHVQEGLDRDLSPALGAAQHARRRGDEVADAVDVEQEAVGAPARGRAAEPGDHDAIRASGGISAWQIATARASASCEVGGISSQREQHLHHPLHLALVGVAVAADGLLDAGRRVLGALDARGGGGDHRGAAGLTDGECDARVGSHVRLLEGDGVRRVRRDELLHPLEDHPQPSSGRSRALVVQHPDASAVTRPPLSWTIP